MWECTTWAQYKIDTYLSAHKKVTPHLPCTLTSFQFLSYLEITRDHKIVPNWKRSINNTADGAKCVLKRGSSLTKAHANPIALHRYRTHSQAFCHCEIPGILLFHYPEDNTYDIPDWVTALLATWGFRSASKRAGGTVTTGPENRGPFKVSNCPCGVITMLAEVCGVLEGEVFSVRKISS